VEQQQVKVRINDGAKVGQNIRNGTESVEPKNPVDKRLRYRRTRSGFCNGLVDGRACEQKGQGIMQTRAGWR
jgi:hypothetical protein